jgi:hypothetical protein
MQYHDTFDMMRDPKYAYLWQSKMEDYYRSATKRSGRRTGGNPGRSKAANPGKRTTPPRKKLQAALREVFTHTPSTVTRAKVSPERKRKMKIAIGFAKARKRA